MHYLKGHLHQIAADYGLGDSGGALLERAAGIPVAIGGEAEPGQHAGGEGARHQHWPQPANLFYDILGWCIVVATSMVILLPILYQVIPARTMLKKLKRLVRRLRQSLPRLRHMAAKSVQELLADLRAMRRPQHSRSTPQAAAARPSQSQKPGGPASKRKAGGKRQQQGQKPSRQQQRRRQRHQQPPPTRQPVVSLCAAREEDGGVEATPVAASAEPHSSSHGELLLIAAAAV